jgi:predicted MFS family arabinose efflux permease
VAILAMPVLAATTLDASTWQVALLSTCGYLPLLLVGLPVGAWADRMRRRRVLIVADVARAVALLSVPVAALLGVLTVTQLYVVEFAVGVGTVFFDVFQAAYVPVLVDRDRLVEANGRLQVNQTVGFSAGPAVGGQLIQWLGPALATVATAVGFLWSALWVSSARAFEPSPVVRDTHLARDIWSGLRFVLTQPFIRATTLYGTAAVACLATRYAVETLFLLRAVGLSPARIGFLVTAAGLGSVAGAFAARPISRALGALRMVAWSSVALALASLLIPLTTAGLGVAFYVAGSGLVGFWIVASNVVSVSLRQMVCPNEMLGRMNATSRFLAWAMLPFGGVIGGALGTAIGLRSTLWITAGGLLVASAALLASGALRPEALHHDRGSLPGTESAPDVTGSAPQR